MRVELERLHKELRRLKEQRAADRRNALEYSFVYRRLASAADGLRPMDIGPAVPKAPSREDATRVRRQLMAQRDQSMFTADLARGHSIEQATADYARAHLTPAKVGAVRSLCQSLIDSPATVVAGNLGWALVANSMTAYDKAWCHFSRVPEEHWRRWAPVEYFDVAFIVDPDGAGRTAERFIAAPPPDVSAEGWLGLARRAFAATRYDVADRAIGIARAARRSPNSDAVDAELAWLSRWIDRAQRPATTIEPASGSVPIAVLDYQHPDMRIASSNVGDYVQTLASLGLLARHQSVELSGPDELVGLVLALRERIPDAQRLGDPAGHATLIPVNRDASSFDNVPDGTWLIAFGWYMHGQFETGFDFPFNPGLRPIFVSFHCNRPNMLTDQAIEYMRRYGPIGCRDWTTVYLLLSVGVPAYFSGCITTTVGTVFAHEPRPDDGRPVAYVDVPRPRADHAGAVIEHSTDTVRRDDLCTNLRRATGLLDTYTRDSSRVVTSRLHCYLPVRAAGTPVDFVPANPADVRFNGLLDLGDEEFAAIRDGMSEKLESTMALMLGGASEDEVYAHWRAICADDVAAAQARLGSVPPIEPPTFDVQAACARIRAEEVTVPRSIETAIGDEVHVALALDANLKEPLDLVVEAATANTGRPLHLWILCRGHDVADFDRFAVVFPEVTCTWLPCDHVDYGEVLSMLGHTTESTFDRLLLPDLLPELDRIVYLDIDILPVGDLADLYEWDLDGRPAAGRASIAAVVRSGYQQNVEIPARRLRDDPDAAHDLYRRMYARHPYDFTTCNAGVLVLDLARMRQDDFTRKYVPFVERYGMHDQHVLNCYLGADRVDLPPEWNYIPLYEDLDSPQLIHWAGQLKPWDDCAVPEKHRWSEYKDRLDGRIERTSSDAGDELHVPDAEQRRAGEEAVSSVQQ